MNMPSKTSTRTRLDLALVGLSLAETRGAAQRFIMAGRVRVDGVVVDKAGASVRSDAQIELVGGGPSYVSRGGQKLAGALDAFERLGLTVRDKIAADFGASTGGFVDCLLQRGALRVHAIDVGYGLLDARLRADPRVVVHERTNARHVTLQALGESVQLVVVDVSFISITKLVGALAAVLVPDGELVALVKPQFEAGRLEAARGRGVIRDEATRRSAIVGVISRLEQEGFRLVAEAPSVLAGPKGNREHFVYATREAGLGH